MKITYKIPSLFLSLVLLFSLISLSAVAESNTVYIRTEEEFFSMEKDPYATYELIDDIFVGKTHDTMFKYDYSAFYGTINGNGHTIHNPIIKSDEPFTAIIGFSYGKINDLNIVSAEIHATEKFQVIGGLVGLNFSTITNCTFDGKFFVDKEERNFYEMVGVNHGIVRDSVPEDDKNSSTTLTANNVFGYNREEEKNQKNDSSSKNGTAEKKKNSGSNKTDNQNNNSSVTSNGSASTVDSTADESNKISIASQNSVGTDNKSKISFGLLLVIVCIFVLLSALAYVFVKDFLVPRIAYKNQADNSKTASDNNSLKAHVKTSNLEKANIKSHSKSNKKK